MEVLSKTTRSVFGICLVLFLLQVAKFTCQSVSSNFVFNYLHNSEIDTALHDLSNRFPHLSKVFSIGHSANGTAILGIQISDQILTTEPGEPSFKLVANIHGNEPVGRQMILYFAEHLLQNYEHGITSDIVDNTNIYLLPSINPDAFDASSEGDCDSFDGLLNANGVDLNSDFHLLSNEGNVKVQPETEVC